MPLVLSSQLADALRRQATVLTANQRAARSIRLAFDEAMQAEGRQLWTPPQVLSLETWMAGLWHTLLLEGRDARILLNRTQEHILWCDLIAADREVSGLRPIDSLAEMAARAWHLLSLYNARPRLKEFTSSTDTRAFERWAREFEQRCKRNLYLPPAELPAALQQALAQGELAIPPTGLALIDFDTLPPAHRHLFESIRQAGYPVHELRTSLPRQTAHLLSAPDESAELRAAATWVRRQLQQIPHPHIAVVVPNLAERRAALERIFSEILAPELQSITVSSANSPYEFSLGHPLSESSLVTSALDLLRWTQGSLPLKSISALLLSPFFGVKAGEDHTGAYALALAEFDAFELRRANLLRPELSLDTLLELLRGSRRRPSLRPLLLRLQSLHASAIGERLFIPSVNGPRTSTPTQRTHTDWADTFRKLLEASGWTELALQDSRSFQAHRRWESALDQLATLDFDGSRPTAETALAALTRITQQTIFAPESRNAAVQVLGPLELGGVPFDHLWFLGADDLSWPPAPSPHPLLPWTLQRSLGMPGASPSRDDATANSLTERIAGSAANIVFSFARQANEGDRRASSALRKLGLTDLACEDPVSFHIPLSLLEIADTEPLPALPAQPISGGAQILELQAACAFRAFAERRLWSTPLDTPRLGLDPRDRGSLVHLVMQAFWTEVETQDTLRGLSLAGREAALDTSIESALREAAGRARTPWDAAYLEVQRKRLRSLLLPWLDLELARPHFAVRERERVQPSARIGPLTLSLRVDRVDDTAAGPLIIDYKTGPAKPADWLSDRPDAPQLPLYAVLSAQPDLAGVAFAQLRAGEDLCLNGFADSHAVLAKPANKLPLATHIDDWRRVLTALAEAFAAGDTRVLPKSYPKTCKYCAQRILCRLDPTALQDIGDDDDEPANPTFAHTADD